MLVLHKLGDNMEQQVCVAMSDKVESHPFNFTANGKRKRYDDDYKEFVKTGLVKCERVRICLSSPVRRAMFGEDSNELEKQSCRGASC